jgi:hypothetical protein
MRRAGWFTLLGPTLDPLSESEYDPSRRQSARHVSAFNDRAGAKYGMDKTTARSTRRGGTGICPPARRGRGQQPYTMRTSPWPLKQNPGSELLTGGY